MGRCINPQEKDGNQRGFKREVALLLSRQECLKITVVMWTRSAAYLGLGDVSHPI